MAACLCWLGVRLLEMHRVLRDDGSLYLHCDPTASHYLKALLDAIFGRKQFRNQIIWGYRTGGVSKKYWARKHDIIFSYVKSGKYHNNPIQERIYYEKSFFTDQKDDQGRFYADVYLRDVWTDVKPLINVSKERFGYPTQKPLALYERIIRASSNEGDLVLDPFCGCATTPVAAERLGREWVGMDIWDKAHDTVIQRLQQEGLAGPDGETDRLLTFGQVGYSTVPPVRSDEGETAAPILKTKQKIAAPPGPRMSRAEMMQFLIDQSGMVCRGCDREFDDPLYLELDHNTPRSDGGLNHISNRLLLCGPCNRIKSNRLTLSGLRAENKKHGRMISQSNG